MTSPTLLSGGGFNRAKCLESGRIYRPKEYRFLINPSGLIGFFGVAREIFLTYLGFLGLKFCFSKQNVTYTFLDFCKFEADLPSAPRPLADALFTPIALSGSSLTFFPFR